ncbi:MAG: helix-turn-helix domain-containing protein [Paracoccus sp. (in: a-proteobacteria)]
MNRATPASYATSTSVLPVFGNNLRFLTSLNGTQAKVCADLDIGRIQFQRYLRGESFPKPHVLKKICDYFMVDARILTDPLNEDLFSEMLVARSSGPQVMHHRTWMSAIGFAVPNQDYFNDGGALDDGLYAMWQWCAARKGTILRKLFKISRKDEATIIRGYAPREFFPPKTSLKDREYRGICLHIEQQGYVFLTFFAHPSQMISMAYVKPMQLSEHSPDALVGFHAITRDELPDMPRLSRVVIEKVGTSPEELLKQAHMPSFFRLDELPEAYADLLSSPPA